MRTLLGKRVQIGCCVILALALSACAAPPPKDFGGHWHAVNHFSAAATPIPLRQSYEYFASPLDGTLKDMLSRWAKDTHRRVEYDLPDDFTLSSPVAAIHTRDAASAIAQLNGIYGAQGVDIAIRGGAFVVTATASRQPAATGSTAATAHASATVASPAPRPATAGNR